jgi:hypothetical protein
MNQCKDCSADRAPGRSRCYPCYGAKRRAKGAAPQSGMKVLYLDIETTPMINYNWGIWQQNVGLSQIIQPQRTMCLSAKWEGGVNQFYAEWSGGHQHMIEEAHDLLDQADVVVHFYGSKFDIPHLNTEFLLAGMSPPSPFKQVDLKLAVSKRFQFPSNKLQYVSTVLGYEGKDKMEFEDWIGCMNGNAKAQKKMEKYNRIDVDLLQDLYGRMLPWIPGLPNRNLYEGGTGCPACKGSQVERDGFYYTALSKYAKYVCVDCGYWTRDAKRIGGVGIQAAAL